MFPSTYWKCRASLEICNKFKVIVVIGKAGGRFLLLVISAVLVGGYCNAIAARS